MCQMAFDTAKTVGRPTDHGRPVIFDPTGERIIDHIEEFERCGEPNVSDRRLFTADERLSCVGLYRLYKVPETSMNGTEPGEFRPLPDVQEAERDKAIRRVADAVHRMNEAIIRAVDAGVSVELVRVSRYHDGRGNWGEAVPTIREVSSK